jgi:cell division protein FtsB
MKKKFPVIILYFVIGVFFAGLISYSAVREAYRNRKIEADISKLNQEKEKIQKENEALSKSIAFFETSQYQEKVAKQKLNLQKADENVVIVKPAPEQEKTEVEPESKEAIKTPETPNYKKWLNFFFKY